MTVLYLLFKKLFETLFHSVPFKEICDDDLEYLLWICNCYVRIKSIPGHIAKIGVASGRNAVYFGRLIKQFGDQSTRQYLGFDTFSGYSPRDSAAHSFLSPDRWQGISKKSVMQRCALNEVADCVQLIEGDVVNTVKMTLENFRGKKFQPGFAKFALLYIDCNAPIPAVFAMENFLPYMSPGGLIVIDEKIQGGESTALFQFASRHNLTIERFGANEVPMAIVIPMP